MQPTIEICRYHGTQSEERPCHSDSTTARRLAATGDPSRRATFCILPVDSGFECSLACYYVDICTLLRCVMAGWLDDAA